MKQDNERPPGAEAAEGCESVETLVTTTSRTSPSTSRARSRSPQKEAPYFWASRVAVKRILDQTADSTLALVYVGLCIMASEQVDQESFTAEIASIGRAVGLSYRSTARALEELELLQFIHIERQFRQSNGVLISRAKKFDQERSANGGVLWEKCDRAPSKYTILSMHPSVKSDGSLPSKMTDPSRKRVTPHLPILGKESLTEGKRDSLKEKETERERATGPLSAATPSGAAEGQHALKPVFPDFCRGGGL